MMQMEQQLKVSIVDMHHSELHFAREKTLTCYKTALRKSQESVFNITSSRNARIAWIIGSLRILSISESRDAN